MCSRVKARTRLLKVLSQPARNLEQLENLLSRAGMHLSLQDEDACVVEFEVLDQTFRVSPRYPTPAEIFLCLVRHEDEKHADSFHGVLPCSIPGLSTI